MAKLRVSFFGSYRTYNWGTKEKDPVIDEMRTMAQEEGLYTRLGILSEITGVSRATYQNWWHGDTKKPNYATIMATATALGREQRWVKTHDLDIEKEREVAARWRERQAKAAANLPKPRRGKKSGK